MIEKIKKYRDTDAINKSLLFGMMRNPSILKGETEQKKSLALDRGSLLDCLMFTPEDYDFLFYKTYVKRPGSKMGEWLETYLKYELPADFTLHSTDDIILKCRKISGYDSRLNDTKALEKFHTECDDFLTEVGIAGDRIIVTDDDFNLAIIKQNKLLNNEFTAPYFDSETNQFQFDVYFDFEGLKFKILLDGVKFDHVKKTIKPWDLKTTSESTLSFEREFLKWGYNIQAALYRTGLKIKYPEYNVLPFDFVVINDYSEPIIWRVDEQLHSLCMNSGYTRSGYYIKGIHELIEDYKWYGKNKKYDYPVDFYTSGGFKTISLL